jgi:cyclase
MLKHRVIPVLLLQEGGLVKTRKFSKPVYIGDPINTIRIFNDKEVDEIIVLDIQASKQGREPDYKLIEECAGECFMPLTYGGGVTNVAQATRLFRLGVEKICIQSAALRDLSIVSELAGRFGSQAVVVSIDVRRNWRGKAQLFNAARGRAESEDWIDFAQRAQSAGAGEIMLNAVNQDGTLAGPDLKLVAEAAGALSVPLVALGGVSSLNDIKAMVGAGASAVAAGAFFVFHGPHRAVLITYPHYAQLEELFDDE